MEQISPASLSQKTPSLTEKVNLTSHFSGNPFEHLLSKKMTAVGGKISLEPPLVSGRHFLMTIRDYLKNPIAASAKIKFSRAGDSKAIASSDKSSDQTSDSVSNPPSAKMSAIQEAIHWAEQKYQVPKKLIASIIHTESAFNPQAKSPVGAMGLMQLMPGTAHELGVTKPFDIKQNIEGGVQYFRKMLDLFGQDTRLALAAYNAGPGAVQRYGGVPPYAETQKYVDRIMKQFTQTNDSKIS